MNDHTRLLHVNPSILAGKPVIVPNVTNDLYPYTIRTLEHYLIHPSKNIIVNNMRTAASLVAQGIGYLFTTPSLLSTNTPEELQNICYCTLSPAPDTRTLTACYHPSNAKAAVIELVIELVKKLVLPYENGLQLL